MRKKKSGYSRERRSKQHETGRRDSLTILRDDIRYFAAERDWDQFHTPKNLAMALIVEAAELVEHFQWLTSGESRSLTPAKLLAVEEEIADVLIYLVRLADKLGIDPLNAARKKIVVNSHKYPAAKSRGNSRKYTEI